jgi:2-amino-4-hydroxy-6-hydroxymethyldihydropteridine diphosphokinase
MTVYLALGSNLGNRKSMLEAAVAGLARRGVSPVKSAGLYHTEPKELAAQPWFLNSVLEATTSLKPLELLDVCLETEQENGRVRTRKNAPRTLDIDIIFYGTDVLETPALTVPHPRYAERRFVLEPLAEIAAGFVDPVRGMTMRDLLARCTDVAVVSRTGPPLFQ